MPDALLEVSGLSKHYRVGARAIAALTDIDLAIERGTVLAIVGESGSGKTTLARLVLGIEQPSAGTMRFAGAPLGARRERALRRKLQLVQQNPYATLNPKRTVF